MPWLCPASAWHCVFVCPGSSQSQCCSNHHLLVSLPICIALVLCGQLDWQWGMRSLIATIFDHSKVVALPPAPYQLACTQRSQGHCCFLGCYYLLCLESSLLSRQANNQMSGSKILSCNHSCSHAYLPHTYLQSVQVLACDISWGWALRETLFNLRASPKCKTLANFLAWHLYTAKRARRIQSILSATLWL